MASTQKPCEMARSEKSREDKECSLGERACLAFMEKMRRYAIENMIAWGDKSEQIIAFEK
ncbi:hypothetical protein M758_UG017600 [Ceratodon purpureus]|nr:hypothetical protein M758_UG017600 [Ceratodon purpureus]